MPDKLDITSAPRPFDLDRERSASMAFEGGVSAAEKELEEELRWAAREAAPSSALAQWRERPGSFAKTVLVGALVAGAAALLTRLVLRWTRR